MSETEAKKEGEEGFVGDAPGSHQEGNATGRDAGAAQMPVKEVKDIGDRMSGGAAEGQGRKEGDPIPKEPAAFDITKLSLEQLQGLKAQLANVPERVSNKQKNPTTLLREFNGDLVTEFSNSYMAVMRDIEQQRDVEMPMIRVKTAKNPDWVQVKYKDFMLFPQIKCEIVRHMQEADRRVEGEVWSKERASYVELEVKMMKHTFEVKLPDGSTVMIDSRMSNA